MTRLLADPRARPALDEFFADWMKVEDLPALDAKNADPTFKTFAGADLPDAKLRQAMIDDVVGMLDYYTWTTPSGARRRCSPAICSFARDARLAKLYGVAAVGRHRRAARAAGGPAPGPADARAVPLHRHARTRGPIMKGVFVRTNILCDDIPPPPPGANAKPPELGPDMTTRESVEAITEMPGTVCVGCHGTAINPLGFADRGLRRARPRSARRSACSTPSGAETGTKPVEHDDDPAGRLRRSDAPISTPAELMSLMLASGKVEACLARNFFRFTYGRWEDTDDRRLRARGRAQGAGERRQRIADLAAAAVKTRAVQAAGVPVRGTP